MKANTPAVRCLVTWRTWEERPDCDSVYCCVWLFWLCWSYCPSQGWGSGVSPGTACTQLKGTRLDWNEMLLVFFFMLEERSDQLSEKEEYHFNFYLFQRTIETGVRRTDWQRPCEMQERVVVRLVSRCHSTAVQQYHQFTRLEPGRVPVWY